MRAYAENKMNELLDNAFNQKFDRNMLQRVPKYIWAALAYFMHDNVLSWLRSSWFFYFFIVLVSSLSFIYFNGYTQTVIKHVRDLTTSLNDNYMQIVHKVPISR